jgi:AAA ATPase domain
MSSSVGGRGPVALAGSPQLFGRQREVALISDVFEHIGARGRSLLIRGEAGIGKSALLGEARRQAEKLRIPRLSTSGVPFETQMPFAGLHRLLRPLLPEIGALPERQREALEVAFAVSDGPAPDTSGRSAPPGSGKMLVSTALRVA